LGGRQGFGWRADDRPDRSRRDHEGAQGDHPNDRPPRPDYRDRPPRPDYRDRPPRPAYGDRPARPAYGDRPPAPDYRSHEPRGPRDPGVPPGPRRPPYDRRPWERDRPYPPRPPRPRYEPSAPPVEPLAEDEELVAGRRPVEEAFVAGREAHRLLVTPQRRHALEQVVLHAARLRIPIVEVEGGSLTALAGFDGHQGVALVVGPRRFASIDDILARAIERGEPPFVLVLDSLEDPQNVGTLLRSAEAAGVHGVIFPTRRQAPLTPSAVKASAGAVEHLLLAPVDDLPGALADLHARGLRIAGAEEDAPLTARQSDLRGPLAIVVGSEGQGLGPAVRRRADTFMRIPMRGAIGSLNAAVAGSILLFEAVAQRAPSGGSTPPRAVPEPVGAEQTDPGPGSEEHAELATADTEAGPESAVESAPEEDDLLPGGPSAAEPSRRRRSRTPRA
jgi:23S rRNA (guanosine2251-2'-O)-methyltransferase